MADLKERVENAETRRQTRTERELALLESSEQGEAQAPVKPRKKPVKKKESVGVGQSSFDLDGAIAKIQARIAATNNPELKAKLAARIKLLKENAGN